MSARRNAGNNRIRGPQSALTDFLAANNISANQIASDYQARQRSTADAERQVETAEAEGKSLSDQEAELNSINPRPGNFRDVESAIHRARERRDEIAARGIAAEEDGASAGAKRRREVEEALSKQKRLRKHQEDAKKKKKLKNKKGGNDDDDDEDEDDLHLAANDWERYRKTKVPGQLENCEACSKRFTVTTYSKGGRRGGLLCKQCSQVVEVEEKKAKPKKRAAVRRDKRLQAASKHLDGIAVQKGARSLVDMCIEKVAKHIDEVDDFGDLPKQLLDQITRILSKRRAITSHTQFLFLRPDYEEVILHDCAKLETDDFIRIFAVCKDLKKLKLGWANQFKNEVIDYMIDKKHQLEYIHLNGANLIDDEHWIRLFKSQARGPLKTVKIDWCDALLNDKAIKEMAKHLPNLETVSFKTCSRLTSTTAATLSGLKKLKHLSLAPSSNAPLWKCQDLCNLFKHTGKTLETLTLSNFSEADDSLLKCIHDNCSSLSKLVLTENDLYTDEGFTSLFTDWANPPLRKFNASGVRFMVNINPNDNKDNVGLCADGFKALMEHSGSALTYLNIKGCRHIPLAALLDVFDGIKKYGRLETIELSFVSGVDDAVLAGLYRSCPAVKRVLVFGCFNVMQSVPPKGAVLLGVPKAQDSLEIWGEDTVGAAEENELDMMELSH